MRTVVRPLPALASIPSHYFAAHDGHDLADEHEKQALEVLQQRRDDALDRAALEGDATDEGEEEEEEEEYEEEYEEQYEEEYEEEYEQEYEEEEEGQDDNGTGAWTAVGTRARPNVEASAEAGSARTSVPAVSPTWPGAAAPTWPGAAEAEHGAFPDNTFNYSTAVPTYLNAPSPEVLWQHALSTARAFQSTHHPSSKQHPTLDDARIAAKQFRSHFGY